jgi:hypothetical protein
MLNHGNTLVKLLHRLSLSSCHSESTLPHPAELLLSQVQQGDLVGHHLRLSNVLERVPRPSCEPLYATNTSHRKQEIFLYEYQLHWIYFFFTNAQQMMLSGSTLLTHGRHFDHWNQPLHIRMLRLLPRLSWSFTVLLPSDTHRKPITSICEVFTDSPSHQQLFWFFDHTEVWVLILPEFVIIFHIICHKYFN